MFYEWHTPARQIVALNSFHARPISMSLVPPPPPLSHWVLVQLGQTDRERLLVLKPHHHPTLKKTNIPYATYSPCPQPHNTTLPIRKTKTSPLLQPYIQPIFPNPPYLLKLLHFLSFYITQMPRAETIPLHNSEGSVIPPLLTLLLLSQTENSITHIWPLSYSNTCSPL